jgi:hypothetical protein
MNGVCRRGLSNSLQEMQRKAFHEIAVMVVTVLARQVLAQSQSYYMRYGNSDVGKNGAVLYTLAGDFLFFKCF